MGGRLELHRHYRSLRRRRTERGCCVHRQQRSYVLAPFNSCSVASGLMPAGSNPALRLGVGSTINPIPASSYEIALYVTNPSSSQTNGCFGISADGVATDSEIAQLQPRTGALLEWSVTDAPTSSTMTLGETASCSAAADVELSGFFLPSPAGQPELRTPACRNRSRTGSPHFGGAPLAPSPASTSMPGAGRSLGI